MSGNNFVGSSKLWGDEATARLCEIVMEANDGIAQQIVENKTDLLDIMTKEELERTDDLGLSAVFLAVYYDRPQMLQYLYKRGVDIKKTCDPMNYGNALFYAIAFEKIQLVTTLHNLGCSVIHPCESVFNLNAHYYAKRKDNPQLIEIIDYLTKKQIQAETLFKKNLLRNVAVLRYKKTRKRIILIQKLARGRAARILIRAYREGKLTELNVPSHNNSVSYNNSQSNDDEDSYTRSDSRSQASGAGTVMTEESGSRSKFSKSSKANSHLS